MIYNIKTQNGGVIGRLELASDLVVEPEQQAAAMPPPPPKTVERKTMLPAAGSFSYEQYQQQGWSDSALVANGYMKIEMVPMDEPAPQEEPALHPSVQDQQLGAQWQAEVPQPPKKPDVPTPPAAPEPPKAPDVPPVPEAPKAPSVPTPPPAAPGVPTPPPAPEPSAPASGGGGDDVPEGCHWVEGDVPQIPGREFMVKDVSYERLADKSNALFDGRIHGLTKDDAGKEVPATRQDSTFKKRRGVDNEVYATILNEQSRYMKGQQLGLADIPAPSTGAAVPPPPADVPTPPGVPTPPPPPSGGQASPQTAPPAPDNIADLEKSLSDWGEEM